MILLREYLSSKKINSKALHAKFPNEFDENLDNVVDFLETHGFDEIQKTIDGSFYLRNAIELFDSISTKSYLRYKVKTGTRLAFSNGGTISKENPLFTVYMPNSESQNIEMYDENFGTDEDGTYLTKRHKTSKEFSNVINEYFKW